MVKLSLPYPPSVNNYWIASGHRRFISKRGKEFKQAVWLELMQSKAKSFGDDLLEVHIDLYPRNKRLMDIDNCCKSILDALQDAGLYNDDKQVYRLVIERKEIVSGGGAIVRVDLYKTPQA